MRRRGVGALRRAGFRGKGARDPILLNLGPSGPGTFARASAAWRSSDNDLLVQAYGSGVLRRYNQGGHWWNVLEGAIENLGGGDPVDISSGGGWSDVGSATTTDDAGTAPDGTATASRITFTASTGRVEAGGGTAPGSSALVRISVWARTESGTKDFRLSAFDGVGIYNSVDLTATTTWQRFTFTFTADVSPTGFTFRISQEGVPAAGSILVWGADAQEDAPNLLVSPVLAATSTKAADDLSFAEAAVPSALNDSSGFWFRIKPYFSSAQHVSHAAQQYLMQWSSGSRFLRWQSGGSDIRFSGDLGGVSSSALSWSARDELTFVVDWSNSEIRYGGFAADGTLNISAAGDWSDGATALQVGANPSVGSPFFGDMSDIYPLATAPI